MSVYFADDVNVAEQLLQQEATRLQEEESRPKPDPKEEVEIDPEEEEKDLTKVSDARLALMIKAKEEKILQRLSQMNDLKTVLLEHERDLAKLK